MKQETDLDSWQSEKTAAFLSRVAARSEPDPVRKAMFRTLAEMAERQATIVARDLGPVPAWRPTRRTRLIAGVTRLIGTRAARPLLAASKVRGLSVYTAGPKNTGHAAPTAAEEIGGKHRGTGGGKLRAAVFGVNDGLVSNVSLVMGVAGAAFQPEMIVLTGAAGLLAGAFSMAAGEYVSMRSQRELYEYQIAQERDELVRYADEEAQELALIYNARGLPMDEAHSIARKLISNPDVALDTLAREELGLNPDDLGSPWGAALWSFLAFSLGAVLPLLPFVAGYGADAIPAAAVLAGLALFGVGGTLSLFSGRSVALGGLRMLLIGALAATATYLIGSLFEVAVS